MLVDIYSLLIVFIIFIYTRIFYKAIEIQRTIFIRLYKILHNI